MSRRPTLFRMVRPWMVRFLDNLPDQRLRDLLVESAVRRAKALSPNDGLRFLYSLESALYPIQGEVAVAYGGGLHPKHRHMRYHDFFVDRIESTERVLDVGCGIGAVAYDVATKAGAEVVGIDMNESNIAAARSQYHNPRLRFVIGDAQGSLPEGRFDTVILSNVLEHLPGRPEFLRRISENVQPSRFLVRVPLFDRHWSVPLKKELGVEWRLDKTHETEYTVVSFAEEMSEAGLSITHQEVRWGEIWAEVVPDGST